MLEDGEGLLIDGTYVHRYGSGEGVSYFAIHGWGGSHETFVPVADHAPRDATIYAIDMPGYGRSRPPSTWTPDAIQARLVRVLDALPDDLVLLGNCSGAIFGLLAALGRPGKFQRAVLVDPFAYFPWYFRIFTWPVLGRFFYAVSFKNPLGRLLTNLGLAKKRTEDSHLTESFTTINHDAVFQTLQVMKAIGGYRTFGPVETRVHVLYGERTFGAVRKSVDLWCGLFSDARASELSGAGHLPLQEATVDFARLAFEDAGPDRS